MKLQTSLDKMEEGKQLEEALKLNDELEEVARKLADFYKGPESSAQPEGSQTLTHHDKQTSSALDKVAKALDNEQHLKTPSSRDTITEMPSPTFSIGSDDEDEDEADDLDKGVGKGKRSSVLKLDTQQLAPREEPSFEAEGDTEAKSKDVPPSPVDKARGQLSEEAEIFRRAKSLNIDGERDDDEDEENSGTATSSTAMTSNGSQAGAEDGEVEANDVRNGTPESDDSDAGSLNGSGRTRSRTSSSVGEVSGDELRKELLETEVPRNAPRVTLSSADTDEARPVDE